MRTVLYVEPVAGGALTLLSVYYQTMESVLDKAMVRYLKGESLVDIMSQMTVRPVELLAHLYDARPVEVDTERWRKEELTALDQVVALGLEYWQAYAAGFSLTSVAEAAGVDLAVAADELVLPFVELRADGWLDGLES